jgi:hypothetical protein
MKMINWNQSDTPARQGDILFVKDDLPRYGLKPLEAKNGKLIVAEGEVTGHHHGFSENDNVTMQYVTNSGSNGQETTIYLVVGEGGATLTHDEHGAIDFEPGTYRVQPQREYDPEFQSRPVWD